MVSFFQLRKNKRGWRNCITQMRQFSCRSQAPLGNASREAPLRPSPCRSQALLGNASPRSSASPPCPVVPKRRLGMRLAKRRLANLNPCVNPHPLRLAPVLCPLSSVVMRLASPLSPLSSPLPPHLNTNPNPQPLPQTTGHPKRESRFQRGGAVRKPKSTEPSRRVLSNPVRHLRKRRQISNSANPPRVQPSTPPPRPERQCLPSGGY